MTNNIQNSEMNGLITKTELLSILECPVCKEMPFPPIYHCINGHSVCKNCKPKLKNCPTCRASLTEKRNYTVEKLVLTANHSCPYKEDGCHVKLRGELMENHMKNCSHRPFKCPWFGENNCSKDLLTLTLAKDHILDIHSVTPTMGPTGTIGYPIPFEEITTGKGPRRMKNDGLAWDIDATEFDGKMFLLLIFGMNPTICFTVLCVGSEEDAQKYRVKIKIISQSDEEEEIKWTVPVKSITKAAELMSSETRHNTFIPSCTVDDIIQMAERNEANLEYIFGTSYTISKRQNVKTQVRLLQIPKSKL